MLLLIPLGVYLWWQKKRLTVGWKRSWSRINWDLHSAAGIYACLFLLLLSVTGFFIASDESLYRVMRSSAEPVQARPHSVPPSPGSARATLDQAMRTADLALPGFATVRIRMPLDPRAAYVVEKRVPEWVAGSSNSAVQIDQYSGKLLRVDDVRRYTRGFRAYGINLALHTGAIFGLPGRIILSIASLTLALLVVTGVLIWLKKQNAVKRWIAALPRPRTSIEKENESYVSLQSRSRTERLHAFRLNADGAEGRPDR